MSLLMSSGILRVCVFMQSGILIVCGFMQSSILKNSVFMQYGILRVCVFLIYPGTSLDYTRLYIPGLYSRRMSIDVYCEYRHTHTHTHTHSRSHTIYKLYTIQLYLFTDRLGLTSLRPMGTLESLPPCTTSTRWAATSTWPPSWRSARSSRTTTRELGVVVFYYGTQ